jgi:cobyrinic acid a,c-diamide synthase
MKGFIPEIKKHIQANINIEQVVGIAKSAKALRRINKSIHPPKPRHKFVKVGVAFDEAFNFYYPGNLYLLEQYGAEVVHFSPIHDKTLPKGVDGLYIGGGFPEFLLKELEANQTMRKAILLAINDGMPVYGECAGLMYLTDCIVDFDQKSYLMVGALNGKTVMTNNTLVTYSHAEAITDNILGAKGSKVKGHEFHNSVIENIPRDAKFAYNMLMGEGIRDKKDGWIKNNVLASYTHIHFAQDQKIVPTFLEQCKHFSKSKANGL